MFGYIYKFTNLINNKIYIGKHKYNKPTLDENYITSGIAIKKAIDKYGLNNFKQELIDIANTNDELNQKEKYWIKFYNCMTPNGYNLTEGGDGISNPSEEIININRIKHLGKKQSEETKAKKNAKLKKVIHTEEWVRKISKANKGQIVTQKQRLISSQAHKNTSWYNDGINEFMLFDYEVTSDLVKGRLKNPFPDQKGVSKPESLKKKISNTKLNQKYRWYNNGIEELFLSEKDDISDGYRLGRLKGFVNKVK